MACYGAVYVRNLRRRCWFACYLDGMGRVVEDGTWKEAWGKRLYILALTPTKYSILVFDFMFYSVILSF